MSGWQTRDPSQARLDELSDTGQLSSATDGQVPVWNDAESRWEPSDQPGGDVRVTVDAGQPDTDGDLTFRYGIDTAGCPYFNTAGASAGEEAIVTLDPADGVFYAQELT